MPLRRACETCTLFPTKPMSSNSKRPRFQRCWNICIYEPEIEVLELYILPVFLNPVFIKLFCPLNIVLCGFVQQFIIFAYWHLIARFLSRSSWTLINIVIKDLNHLCVMCFWPSFSTDKWKLCLLLLLFVMIDPNIQKFYVLHLCI